MPQTDTVNLDDLAQVFILRKHSGSVSACLLFVFYWSTASPGIGWFDSAGGTVISQWGTSTRLSSYILSGLVHRFLRSI